MQKRCEGYSFSPYSSMKKPQFVPIRTLSVYNRGFGTPLQQLMQ
jgi:hypothetical protein